MPFLIAWCQWCGTYLIGIIEIQSMILPWKISNSICTSLDLRPSCLFKFIVIYLSILLQIKRGNERVGFSHWKFFKVFKTIQSSIWYTFVFMRNMYILDFEKLKWNIKYFLLLELTTHLNLALYFAMNVRGGQKLYPSWS